MANIITPVFRASWVFVWEPRQDKDGNDVWRISMIFDKEKTTPKEIDTLRKGIQQAIAAEMGEDQKKWPRQIWNPLRDSDKEERTDPNSENYDPIYINSYNMNAKSYQQPGIVDENVQPILDQSDFYPGCYARASVRFKWFSKAGNKGVRCILVNLMKVADGEPLGATNPNPENEFSQFASKDDATSDFQ